jgi:uncharacterized protein YjbI with pentapeptide repeats
MQLVMLAQSKDPSPPGVYFDMAASLLAEYVRFNIDDRKRLGPGIREDRGMYIPSDIIQALIALQELRKANDGKLIIRLWGLNFDRINLAYVDLEAFDMSFSIFRNAALGPKLRGVRFQFAVFDNTAIWNADLSGANFHKAAMKNAKFMTPELTNTNIQEAFGLEEMLLFCKPIGLSSEQQHLISHEKC